MAAGNLRTKLEVVAEVVFCFFVNITSLPILSPKNEKLHKRKEFG